MKSILTTALLFLAAIGIQLATALPSPGLDVSSRAEANENDDIIPYPTNHQPPPSYYSNDGKIVCDNNPDHQMIVKTCGEALDKLSSDDYGMRLCNTPGNSMTRVQCSGVCAIYVKNPNGNDWAGYCRDVASDIYRIVDKCRANWGGLPEGTKGISAGELEFFDHTIVLIRENC